MRYAFMDVVSRLYGENYGVCSAIGAGAWRAYIGHVIEQTTRMRALGSGVGHFFRALWDSTWRGSTSCSTISSRFKNGSHANGLAGF